MNLYCSYGPKGQVALKLGWRLNYSFYGSYVVATMSIDLLHTAHSHLQNEIKYKVKGR